MEEVLSDLSDFLIGLYSLRSKVVKRKIRINKKCFKYVYYFIPGIDFLDHLPICTGLSCIMHSILNST